VICRVCWLVNPFINIGHWSESKSHHRNVAFRLCFESTRAAVLFCTVCNFSHYNDWQPGGGCVLRVLFLVSFYYIRQKVREYCHHAIVCRFVRSFVGYACYDFLKNTSQFFS